MFKTLASEVAATGTVTQTAVQQTTTPGIAGRTGLLTVEMITATTTATVLIEGSDDGTTYTTIQSCTHIGKVKQYEVTLKPYMRARQSVAGGAGTYSAWLYIP